MRCVSVFIVTVDVCHVFYRVAQKSKLLYCDNSLLFLSHPACECLVSVLLHVNLVEWLSVIDVCLIDWWLIYSLYDLYFYSTQTTTSVFRPIVSDVRTANNRFSAHLTLLERALDMAFLSVCLSLCMSVAVSQSICLSNACILTKRRNHLSYISILR